MEYREISDLKIACGDTLFMPDLGVFYLASVVFSTHRQRLLLGGERFKPSFSSAFLPWKLKKFLWVDKFSYFLAFGSNFFLP